MFSVPRAKLGDGSIKKARILSGGVDCGWYGEFNFLQAVGLPHLSGSDLTGQLNFSFNGQLRHTTLSANHAFCASLMKIRQTFMSNFGYGDYGGSPPGPPILLSATGIAYGVRLLNTPSVGGWPRDSHGPVA